MSQTSALNSGGSKKIKMGLNSFGTEILEVCKRSEIVSEYDQEILQSQTADNSVAPRGRAAQPS